MAGPDPLGRLVGAVVPRAVESIDLNEVMTEVDVNALLDRIDLDRLLERVDVDRLLERVDVEQLIHRVDIEEIIRRAQVDAIVGATASTFSHRMLDGIRRQLVGFDIITTRLVDRVAHRHIDVPVEDNGSFTGQRAGGATRLTAFLVDVLTVSVLFTAAVSLLLFLA